MAQGYGNYYTAGLDGALPAKKVDGRVYGARRRTYRQVLDLSKATVAKNSGDTNVVLRRPAATAFDGGSVTVSATLGTATLAIGTAGNPTKYLAATTFTTTDTPVGFGKGAARGEDPIVDAEDIIVTIGTAALPGAGLIVIDFNTLAR